MADAIPPPAFASRPAQACDWSGSLDSDCQAGVLHQLDTDNDTMKQSKRPRRNWNVESRTYTSLFEESKKRVDACMNKSVAAAVCVDLADQLHKAMYHAPIDDMRLSVAGEKHRILTRAMALKETLQLQDSMLAAKQVKLTKQSHARCKTTASHHKDGRQQQGPRVVTMQRSSNEEDPDATPEQCLLAVCLLLAALYEQTPWGEGSDLRRRVFTDFTMLKKHFREDSIQVLRGQSGSNEELFSALKAVDRSQGLENLMGLIYEDWDVHKRIDQFIMSEHIEVEVLTLTSDGPIGKFKCRMRTLATIGLLQQRLLRELYHGAFAGRIPSRKDFETMAVDNELDFLDFSEAMARNIPYKHVDGAELWYAWMYAPEVHATPEGWGEVFGPGANNLPTFNDKVNTPDDMVTIIGRENDFALEVDKAAEYDFLEQGSSMSACTFPWGDDLLGAYLRKVREQPRQEWNAIQRAKKEEDDRKREEALNAMNLGGPIRRKASSTNLPATRANSIHRRSANGVADPGVAKQGQAGAQSDTDSQQSSQFAQRRRQLQKSVAQSWTMRAKPGTKYGPPKDGADRYVPPIPNADQTGHLALPVGIFMVGIICSGAFTNTQIHVEDLLLMSININMFGAPKMWWWIPRAGAKDFKELAEQMTDGGRKELYTKSISPFLTDKEKAQQPEQVLPLEELKELGARRTIQLPGMAMWTMPGYAFHFTVSTGFNIAESVNMFLEVMGWTFDKVWAVRPPEQYPEPEDDMCRYMRETGMLARLGVPDRPPRDPEEVHRDLDILQKLSSGPAERAEGTARMQRVVQQGVVKYSAVECGVVAPGDVQAVGASTDSGSTESTAMEVQAPIAPTPFVVDESQPLPPELLQLPILDALPMDMQLHTQLPLPFALPADDVDGVQHLA